MQRTDGTPGATALATPMTAWSDRDVDGADRQARGRMTRRALLLAAARQFDRHGYHGANLRDIVQEAEVTKGALYFHFDSKQDMTEALVTEVYVSWAAIVDEVARRGLDPLWQLLVETDAYVARWAHDPLVRGSSRALIESGCFVDARRRWMDDWCGLTVDRFRRAAARGLLKPQVDPEGVGRLLQAISAGHHTLAECDGGHPHYWTRMCDAWRDLLPAVADDDWVAGWRASAWEDRPSPDPARYDEARRP